MIDLKPPYIPPHAKRVPHRHNLFHMLKKNSIGCEVGVLTGILSKEILRIAQPKVLHLVDFWRDPIEVKEATKFLEDNIPHPANDHWVARRITGPEAMKETLEKFKDEIARGTVRIHHQMSQDFLATLPDHSLDWIYLDSDHSYPTIHAELRLARKKVKWGGWIMGHDYCTVLPDVEKAVDEFCRKFNLTVAILTDEYEYPVYLKPDGYPDFCAFNSFAIINEPIWSCHVLRRIFLKHWRRHFGDRKKEGKKA